MRGCERSRNDCLILSIAYTFYIFINRIRAFDGVLRAEETEAGGGGDGGSRAGVDDAREEGVSSARDVDDLARKGREVGHDGALQHAEPFCATADVTAG